MGLWVLSFVAGVLTVLAPCVLPILPILLGGSIWGDRWRPWRIIGAFAVAIFLFSLFLKVVVVQLHLRPETLVKISATLLIIFGISILLPRLWNKLTHLTKLEQMTGQATQWVQQTIWGDIALGFLLGPLFNTCSPTYALLVSTILPSSFWSGVLYILAYTLWLVAILSVIILVGRTFVKKLHRLADPRGWFKIVLGVLLIVIGVSIRMKREKKLETRLIEHHLFVDTTQWELRVLKEVKEEMK